MTAIVLLPGLDGTGELFAPLVAAWGDRFRTQVVSYPRVERLGYAALADRVRALLPLHEDYVLLAESFSGPLGVMLAAERPQRLRGLVLCATFARSPLPLLRWMAPLAQAVSPAVLPDRALAWGLLGRYATPSLVVAIRQAVSSVSPSVLAERIGAVAEVDVADLLSEVRVPVLYLQARNDRVVSQRAVKPFMVLGERLRVVSCAGPHCLLQASPGDAAAVISTFISSLPKTSE
ncbi:alpha/beta fold hydrolase [Acidovorax sp. 106]|uniref:alpha/beta fold hydrolase n=1 Tax=Acidovorax sp. 106 TaxID=2135637 RepID=UPI000EB28C05|nr:alpha/beta hydrolase [Acidovorax sp. 106]RLJ36669.1 serine aminopeptidase S33 family [Acidovorax sp. 106]